MIAALTDTWVKKALMYGFVFALGIGFNTVVNDLETVQEKSAQLDDLVKPGGAVPKMIARDMWLKHQNKALVQQVSDLTMTVEPAAGSCKPIKRVTAQ